MRDQDLIPHPEGGRYREIYRSTTRITSEHQGTRAALTHIYFSLCPPEVSRFHKVASDEVWNLYQGQGLWLYQWDGSSDHVSVIELSGRSSQFCHVVPAGYWQAARPMTERVLVGCTVAPGFEFADFELIDLQSETAARLIALHPDLQFLVE
ncbi:cupin domain-containing protein [Synechococcales cyanobacterium C]|uniref:Cupin domain-containing protein n=1 Tax=Petrachloros mirabilis ULC683 TaxID=2781853 RepID=A0A8K1ZZV3_9CYAN|nr:cupin domain-containing protein [Petrachloros mirabilis]NCJ08370.1 cupin domain-containing protein [Petrachloros mirabilis ULC683]